MPFLSFREQNFIKALKNNDLALVEDILRANSDGLPYHIVDMKHLAAWKMYLQMDCFSTLQKQRCIADTIEKGMIDFVVAAIDYNYIPANDMMLFTVEKHQTLLLEHLVEKENFYPYFYDFFLLQYAEEVNNAQSLIYLVQLAKDTVPETYQEIKTKYTTGIIANVVSGIDMAEDLRSMPYKSKHTAQNKI